MRSGMLAANMRDGVGEIRERLMAMEQEYMEAWMNGGAPGGGSSGSGFTLNFIAGEDPYLELIDVGSGQMWSFDDDFFEDVLDGSAVLPPPLMALLLSQGINDPMLFAQQMLQLFNNS